MKSFLALMLLLCVSFSYTHAGDESSTYEKKEPIKMEERAIIEYDHDLELELENGVVEAEWDEFDIDGFDWFKLVYSTTNSRPVYPDDRTVFVGSKDQTEAEFKLATGSKNHYVRLCAVVLNDDYSKDRYCGDTRHLITTEEDFVYRDDKKEYVTSKEKREGDSKEKAEYDKESAAKIQAKREELQKKLKEKQNQVSEKKESVAKKVVEKKAILSANMKQRIDTVIKNFIEKLDDRGYSDAQMTSAINTVISRLGEFRNKTGYKEIVKYMVIVLEEYREEYSNPLEDLESIFDGL